MLAREFAKRGVSQVCGSDISETQSRMARELAAKSGLQAQFVVAAAEEQPFGNSSFDVFTANQCWLYFDKSRTIPELKRLLKSGGLLVTSHFCWLPRRDELARRTEDLILAFNPQWTAVDYSGEVPPFPK